MEQSTIQSLGFPLGFQEDIKIPRPHGTINHTVTSFSFLFIIGFQEDIKIPQPHGTLNNTVTGVFNRVSRRYQNPPAPWNN